MKKFSLIAIFVLLAWYGRDLYYQNGLDTLQKLGMTDSEKSRCITKDGKVLYGKIPPGTTCEKTEEVTASLSVIASKFADKSTASSAAHSPSTTSTHSKCDGRTLCSQMTSCEEATFFVNNCPGVQMDGDNDGVPCESQWCR